MQSKIILYIAMSLDGFIAREEGSIDWLTQYENGEEDYGFKQLYDRVDKVFVGGKTFRQIPEPFEGKEVYVFTSEKQHSQSHSVHFVSGEVTEVIRKLNSNSNIWLVGGADLLDQFLKANRVDEYMITLIPVLLGKGIPLFKNRDQESCLNLKDVRSYPSGLVQLHYESRIGNAKT